MKKFLYGIMLLAVACMTATALVSCEENEETEKVDVKEQYLCFKYWLSNDLLDIVDITAEGIDTPVCTNAATYRSINGKESGLIELNGKDAASARFSIKLTLKPNWKEIIAEKETMDCYHAWGTGSVKGEGTVSLSSNIKGGSYSRKSAGAEFEDKVAGYIETLKVNYNAAAL